MLARGIRTGVATEPIASRRAFLCSMAGALALTPLGAQA